MGGFLSCRRRRNSQTRIPTRRPPPNVQSESARSEIPTMPARNNNQRQPKTARPEIPTHRPCPPIPSKSRPEIPTHRPCPPIPTKPRYEIPTSRPPRPPKQSRSSRFEIPPNRPCPTQSKSRSEIPTMPSKNNNERQPKTSDSSKPSKSVSEEFRQNGNKCYQQFIASTNLEGKKKYLEDAIKFYRKSFDAANSKLESSRAAKNLGTATIKLINNLMKINAKANPLLLGHLYLDAISSISLALHNGKPIRPVKWTKDLELLFSNCIESALKHVKQHVPYERRMGSIDTFIQAMTGNSLEKAKCYLEVAKFTFQKGVVCLREEEDYKAALHEFKDCHRPTQEAKRLAREVGTNADKILEEADIIEADLVFHLASAESLQAIDTGDKLLKIAVGNNEQLSMDLIYDVIDWYKKAVVGARGIDVEVEALALSQLGCLYDRVLKIKFKAKEYFLRCMQLGVSLFPKSVNQEVWFMNAMYAMKRYQQEAVKNDNSAQSEERKKYLEELKSELNQLSDAASRGPIELVKFVYKTFPPKDPKHSIPDDEVNDSNRTKKVLLKAILHYHPDKQSVDDHGRKWQVLCGEITSEFTRKYECFKLGGDD